MPHNDLSFRVRWETQSWPAEMGFIDVFAFDAGQAVERARRLLFKLAQSNRRHAHQWPVRVLEVTLQEGQR